MSKTVRSLIFCLFSALSMVVFPARLNGQGALPEDTLRMMREAASWQTVYGDFVQKKKLPALKAPIVVTGSFAMEKDGRIAWRIKSPIVCNCVIANGRLLQWDAASGKTVSLDVSKNRLMNMMMRMMTLLSSGGSPEQAAALKAEKVGERSMKLHLEQHPVLKSVGTNMLIRFASPKSYVERILVNEQNGGWVLLTFQNVKPDEPIPAAMWEIQAK